MFARALRAETRSRARDDNRRVHKSSEKVQRWEKKWVPVKDTSMLIYKWVPVAEDEHAQPKKSGFVRAQANVLPPTGGSIITMSSRPPELRTEDPPPNENISDRMPKVETSSETSNDADVKDVSGGLAADVPVDLTSGVGEQTVGATLKSYDVGGYGTGWLYGWTVDFMNKRLSRGAPRVPRHREENFRRTVGWVSALRIGPWNRFFFLWGEDCLPRQPESGRVESPECCQLRGGQLK
uniref:B cell CLL:lymphoma 7 protein family member A n=1 Tax=Echinococcus granulosus TaxID=6210 RepID=A0A068WCA3_ECHGR|nr:B cell CLL:lymphoma 7 protein family member A [Echinococcus granulosus]